ncbi:MAG: ATP-binding protein [Thermoguttaceae bacterium]|jgi:predicted ATPase|nr:ATP-binding protein [Thermoguttaceae bacterium]
MIESIEFRNFKVLRETTLPLGRCTVLVGPNGSGKSTVLKAMQAVRDRDANRLARSRSLLANDDEEAVVQVKLNWAAPYNRVSYAATWSPRHGLKCAPISLPGAEPHDRLAIEQTVRRIRVFALDPRAVAQPAVVKDRPEIAEDGGGLAAVLDGMRDSDPERFDRLNSELRRWLPEYEGIRFEKPQEGHKAIALQTRHSSARVPAADLSQGTLVALAILTLAYLPEPPAVVGLEEPDRGVHPRLLRHVRDALYRLAYPENFGEHREPVQVIATTHSPYFLDQFREHPEEVVIANRVGDNVRFERLSDRPSIQEILGEAPLGEVWYTGVLGGVPSEP